VGQEAVNRVGGALETVLRYHHQTKHQFARYASAPDTLDWANQPDPFRRFAGSPRTRLPRLKPAAEPTSPPYEALHAGAPVPSAGVDAAALSRFLECSFAVSA